MVIQRLGFVLFPLIFSLSCNADERLNNENTYPQFTQYDEASSISLSYPGLDKLYGQVVVKAASRGRLHPDASDSHVATKAQPNSAHEANRFYFAAFADDADKALLTRLRTRVQEMPSQVPLAQLNKSEQLAYWLNLYNLALVEKLVQHYPKKRLQGLLFGDHALLEEPFIEVAGDLLSLNDIQHNIVLPNYSDLPEVIYGFHQGYIGSPDIRTLAYTGANVIAALKENADRFINSNRGTQTHGRDLLVSRFYADNIKMFAGYGHDLREHLAAYADKDIVEVVASARRFLPTITNWQVVDVTTTDSREADMSGQLSDAVINIAGLKPAASGPIQQQVAQNNSIKAIGAVNQNTDNEANGKL